MRLPLTAALGTRSPQPTSEQLIGPPRLSSGAARDALNNKHEREADLRRGHYQPWNCRLISWAVISALIYTYGYGIDGWKPSQHTGQGRCPHSILPQPRQATGSQA
jgi:hypothetical protein